MKRYTLSFGQSIGYKHPAPDRTAKKPSGWDNTYQVWPSRAAMAVSIRMQQRGIPSQKHWVPLVPLADHEGY